MCTVDASTEIHVKLTCELPGDQEDTWIAWGQSEGQRVLLNTLDCKHVPLYAEGPYLVWLRGKSVEYFVLKTDKLPDYDLKMKQLTDFDEFDGKY
jgi:signaling intermediate in Toll pathway protein